jgi:hypothetical protein
MYSWYKRIGKSIFHSPNIRFCLEKATKLVGRQPIFCNSAVFLRCFVMQS